MQSDDPPQDHQAKAISAYLKTLKAPPSISRLRGQQDQAAVTRGKKLFAQRGCETCHKPPSYTTPAVYDVGLRDKLGNKEFNPPTLIGVGQRGPYFHDNRAKTLRDVFVKHRHQLEKPISPAQIDDLLEFLLSL